MALWVLGSCLLFVVIVSGAAACLLLLLHVGPLVFAVAVYGTASHLPDQVPWGSFAGGIDGDPYVHSCEVGSSAFANPQLYGPGRFDLPASALELYRREGYVVLRGLVPRETVDLLRGVLLPKYSFEVEKNAHWESRELRDFLVFGSLADVAHQLFGGRPTHLLRSVHHFRPTVCDFRRVTNYHYDWLECAEDLPSHGVSTDILKLNLALHDDMPAMWFVNESAFERAVLRGHNESFLRSLRAGPDGPPISEPELDEVSLKPVLSRGDVIAHSISLTHRSPPAEVGGSIAFLSPSYATAASECLGRPASNRECDAGFEEDAAGPGPRGRIGDAPRPECFPQVRPLSLGGRHGPDCRIHMRRNFGVSKTRSYFTSLLTRWLLTIPGRPNPPPADRGLPPGSNVVAAGPRVGEAPQQDGVRGPHHHAVGDNAEL